MSNQETRCANCGHSRADHDEEPPFGCNFLEEGVDCEDDDYCFCPMFSFVRERDSTTKATS